MSLISYDDNKTDDNNKTKTPVLVKIFSRLSCNVVESICTTMVILVIMRTTSLLAAHGVLSSDDVECCYVRNTMVENV